MSLSENCCSVADDSDERPFKPVVFSATVDVSVSVPPVDDLFVVAVVVVSSTTVVGGAVVVVVVVAGVAARSSSHGGSGLDVVSALFTGWQM
jgi:hypothetical protein